MRFVLILFLIHGLAPGFGEIVETVVHRIQTGQFAHAAGEPHDEGPASAEHGCGATAHRCQCCPTLSAVARSTFSVDRPRVVAQDSGAGRIEQRADGISSLVFRPPIV